MKYKQGDIVFVDLNPAKGHEQSKIRPCLIISNNKFNIYFNTVIVIPISSAKKYQTEEKYIKSPMFIDISSDKVKGTALLQHLRSIDSTKRFKGDIVDSISSEEVDNIIKIINQFF